MPAPLVGRAQALTVLDQALAEVCAGNPVALGFAGEPGIGKTRLLTELAMRAHQRDLRVLRGRASEFEPDRPYALFVDLLDDYLAALGPARGSDTDGYALARVFPAMSGYRPSPGEFVDRLDIYRAVRKLLARMARSSTLVLILDDLHWADYASINLLVHLVNRPLAGPILLALGYRRERLPASLRSVLHRAEFEHRLRVVTLDPLSRADAARLISQPGGLPLPAQVVDELYVESGGVPFYLLELAKLYHRADPGWTHRPTAEGVPRSVVDAIEAEITALPEPAQALVRGAAVVGDPFDVDLAALATGIEIEPALRALDEVVASDVVQATDVPGRYAFRHPLLRRAVYQTTGPSCRTQAHRRLASALHARGAPLDEQARHVEAGAQPGDLAAVALLARAGQALLGRAPTIAARRFRAALRLLPHDPEHASQRLALTRSLAGALPMAGQLQAARSALVETLRLLPPNQLDPRVELEANCAAIEHLLGLHAEAHTRLRAALRHVSPRNARAAAQLEIELCVDALWASDWDGLLDWARRANGAARRSGDPGSEVTALSLLAWGHLGRHSVGAGVECLDAAGARWDAATDQEIAGRPDSGYWLAAGENMVERYADACRHAERSIAAVGTAGYTHFLVLTLAAKAVALRCLGQLPAAVATAAEAVDRARLAGQGQMLRFALWVQTWTTAPIDLDLALASGEEAVGLCVPADQATVPTPGSWAFGEALLDAGDPARAATVVLDLAGGPDACRLPPIERCHAWQVLALAELRQGNLDGARRWLRRLEVAARRLDRLRMPTVRLGVASAALRLTEADPAAAHLGLGAAAAAEQVGAWLDAARARLLAGQALAAAGDTERGVTELERARAVFERCGAPRYRDQAARELRRLGQSVGRGGRRRQARLGIEALSERERVIAERAATGKTNNQIAAELFLSPKTIERHLTHVYRKLDLTSRAQLGLALRYDIADVLMGSRLARHRGSP